MAATINTVITAQDRTAKAFNSVSKRLGRMNKSIGESVTRLAKIGAAFAASGVAAGVALTKMSMTSIGSLAKTADKIGATTGALAGLRHAAEMTGVSSKTMDMAMQRLTRRISEAASGTGEAKDALLELGLNAEILEQLPLDTRMEHIADAMNKVDSQADKVRLSMKLFDSEGVAVVNTLAGGSEGLKEFAAEADKLGLAVSRVDAAKIELANDAVTRAKGVFTGLGNQLAINFSPLIETVANNFRQAALDSEDFGTIGQRVVQILLRGYGALADSVFFLRMGFAKLTVGLLRGSKVILEKIAPAFEYLAEKYNVIADAFGRELIDTGKVEKMASNMEGAIGLALDRVSGMMAQGLPSEGINATFEEIVATSRRAAEEIAKNAPGEVLLANLNETTPPIIEKLTFLQKQAKEGAKKRTEFENKTMTEQTSHVLGELSNQFSGIASNNKALFDMNKAFQISNAIMQTYQAATLALASYPPPLSFAMAAASVASGLGQVAQIRAQSFEGGGFTGIGPRSGGVDGKGGFLSLLHPNESVIDHTKGQGQGVTINNYVDATGSGPDVDQKIKQAMIQTSNATIGTIQDLMRRGRFA